MRSCTVCSGTAWNSHAKSHVNVYQYRCADCVYASKYCHSFKLHLRKHGHRPAAVLNHDDRLPTDGSRQLDRVARRGPPQGPRTAPPSSRRKLSRGGVERAWSVEAQIGTSVLSSEAVSGPLPDVSCWPPEQFRVAQKATSPKSLVSRDPYAFVADDDADSLTDVGRRTVPTNSDDDDVVARCADDSAAVMSTVGDERSLPATKRQRNAEFVAKLTANIEAELVAEDRPLDLTARSTSKTAAEVDSGSVTTSTVSADARQDDASSSPTSSISSDTSRGARRRKSVAQRRADVVDEITEANEDFAARRPLQDRRGFVECRHCRIGFRDRVTYALHMGYHGFDAPFSCNMCGHQAGDRVEFFVHIATAAH